MRLQQLITLSQEHERQPSEQIQKRMENIFVEMTPDEHIQILMLLGYRSAERQLLRAQTKKAITIALIPAVLFPLVTVAALRSNQAPASDQIAAIVPFAALLLAIIGMVLILRWLRNAESRLPNPPQPEQPIPVLTAKNADALYSLFHEQQFLSRLVEMRRYSPYRFAPDKQIAYLIAHSRKYHAGLNDEDYNFLLSLTRGTHPEPASTELQEVLHKWYFTKMNFSQPDHLREQ